MENNKHINQFISNEINKVTMPSKLKGENLLHLLDNVEIEPVKTNSNVVYLKRNKIIATAAAFVFIIGFAFFAFYKLNPLTLSNSAQLLSAPKSAQLTAGNEDMLSPKTYEDIINAINLINKRKVEDMSSSTAIMEYSADNGILESEKKQLDNATDYIQTIELENSVFGAYVNSNSFYCIDILNKENSNILSTISLNNVVNFEDMYLYENNLITVFEQYSTENNQTVYIDNQPVYLDITLTSVNIYDIENLDNPNIIYEFKQEGAYDTALLYENTLTLQSIKSMPSVDAKHLPTISLVPTTFNSLSNSWQEIPFDKISINDNGNSCCYTITSSIDVNKIGEVSTSAVLGR